MKKNTDDQKFRRLALAVWIESKGGMKLVVEDRKLPNSVRSQMNNHMNGYCFGVIAARNLEKKLDMPIGWLDTMEGGADSPLVEGIDSQNKEKVLSSIASGLASSWETMNIPYFPFNEVTTQGKNPFAFKGTKNLLRSDYEPKFITDFRVSSSWFKKHVPAVTHINNLYVITGMTDSENPNYFEGDPLLIDAGVKSVEADAVFLFKLNGMDFIKRVQRSADRALRIMHSDSLFDSWVVTPDMDFQVLGKVLKIWRSETC